MDKLPLSPSNCEHKHALFVQAGNVVSTETHSREQVELCPDCGKFLIYGHKDGVYFRITFTLPTPELVEAAGQFVKFLNREQAT